jgi:hypothetical protein
MTVQQLVDKQHKVQLFLGFLILGLVQLQAPAQAVRLSTEASDSRSKHATAASDCVALADPQQTQLGQGGGAPLSADASSLCQAEAGACVVEGGIPCSVGGPAQGGIAAIPAAGASLLGPLLGAGGAAAAAGGIAAAVGGGGDDGSGSAAPGEPIPEPSMIPGSLAALGFLYWLRKKRKSEGK